MKQSRKMNSKCRTGVALLLLGVGFLVFVFSSRPSVFDDQSENKHGSLSTGRHASEAMAITDYNISPKPARLRGENWAKSSAPKRRSLLQTPTPGGGRPSPPVPSLRAPPPAPASN
ncbi:hypothetical protein KC19_6G174000 [Ceratodon purpureus]|uniref:Uncharacterized protein n=1 Tax=Ceratodon purpureus TaxID=3225 RepID=A0A8T0HIL6_CERPU|nr:hypothetical protein KC19_6G174000 [Ceratodon purpureus]